MSILKHHLPPYLGSLVTSHNSISLILDYSLPSGHLALSLSGAPVSLLGSSKASGTCLYVLFPLHSDHSSGIIIMTLGSLYSCVGEFDWTCKWCQGPLCHIVVSSLHSVTLVSTCKAEMSEEEVGYTLSLAKT